MIRDIGIRLMTAIGFTAWVIGSLYYSYWSYYLFFGLVAFMCSYEYLRITQPGRNTGTLAAGALGVVAMGGILAAGLNNLEGNGWPYLISVIALTVVLFFTTRLNIEGIQPFGIFHPMISALLYIGLPCILALVAARYSPGYPGLPLLGAIPLIWANDTGAYLTGSWFGKTPLYPEISPKKSVEGTLGGMLICIMCAVPLSYYNHFFTPQQWIIVAILTGLAAITGDLLESKFKRYYGVKDTGTILPGHGGFMDRFDSFLFLMPFLATFIIIIKG